MSEQQKSGFFRTYDLTKPQKQPKDPAAHQYQALDKLHKWFQAKHSDAGGILVLPTGGGKTFTAVRFLCTEPLSNGYKVLWLAHTHHLLDQAFYSLESEVKLIRNKQQLNVRVVSGTTGHFRPCHIQASDDVMICTLQTVTRAYQNKVAQLENFIKAAGNKLFVVFDEAHHSPAPSYCRFILELRDRTSGMYLLGLTATPTYTDKHKRGWLKKLFPQEILCQISPEKLMADGILAKPIFETSHTTFTPEFDEYKYQQWVRDFRELPEEIITKLADNRERNAFIAKTYADNKERYGKTIIFADRWFQCIQLREFLEQQKKGIRVGTMFAHVEAYPGSADAINKQDKDENAKTLEAFRNNQLDVLINVRMLTEGTDVPNVNTVFLTRQTTSKILLTQMVGRALRGSKFGGTDEANIVSFIDNWQHLINWAEFELEPGGINDSNREVGEPLPMQLISIDLVRRLVRQMDSGININDVPFLTLMPVGWYRVELETLTEGNENIEIVQRLVMVFKNEKESYENYIESLKSCKESELETFVEPTISFDKQHQQRVESLQEGIFSNLGQHIGGDLLTNLFYITCHMAQNDREPPDWFDFKERQEHNLDDVAQRFIDADLGPRSQVQTLQSEWQRTDRYWKIIYHNFNLFKSQYDACANRILLIAEDLDVETKVNGSYKDEKLPPSEPPDLVKKEVKRRDKYRCLCCGETKRHLLVIDHIKPKYHGGFHSQDNLQTLCITCNTIKGIETIDFRIHQTPLNAPKATFPHLEFTQRSYKIEADTQLQLKLRRSVNFLYYCDAVKHIDIDPKGHYQSIWQISLNTGNDPRWLISHHKYLFNGILQARKKEGFSSPESIIINAPGFDVIAPIKV